MVDNLMKKITSIIKKDWSTPGVAQDFVKENWTQLSWMEF